MKAFECRMCGECCFGEGGITVNEKEARRIARFLGITPESFLSRFCESRNGRYYIKSGEDKYCIFFDQEKNCLIHPVKPDVCSRWPFFSALLNDRENWKAAQEACPGINPECSFEEFLKQGRSRDDKTSGYKENE